MVSVVQEERRYRKIIDAWKQESRQLGKPFCQTCAREDNNKNMLAGTWTEYANLEFIRDIQSVDPKNPGKVLEIIKDYKCPRGHGVSFSIIPPKKKEE
jgi:hypothetical protein